MKLLEILCCTDCSGELYQRENAMICRDCGAQYCIKNSIPRFVPESNYANNFGFQWNQFRTVQLDSHTGVPISRERFFRTTGWNPGELRGKRVLDAGCGSGRFTEVALSCGAEVVAIDYSSAVEACWLSLGASPSLSVVQADITNLPFHPGSFDFIYCLGVLQHTPDARATFVALVKQLCPGGKLVVDVYRKTKMNWLWPKYWLRPITRRLDSLRLFAILKKLTPPLLRLSDALSFIPGGRRFRYLIPIPNYRGMYPLSDEQLRTFALLDAFDMLSPAYDSPQSIESLRNWAVKSGLEDIETLASGHNICRGTLKTVRSTESSKRPRTSFKLS